MARRCRKMAKQCDPSFIIVGYGKLGGLELGYGSDLDLVFIHAAGSGRNSGGCNARANAIETVYFLLAWDSALFTFSARAW